MRVTSKQAPRDWTVLYYLNGNNDLEPSLVKNLMEAEKVGSTDRVDIVAQLARAPRKVVHGSNSKATRLDGDWTGVRRYHIESGSSKTRILSPPLQQSENSPNHGQEGTLADFLQWGMKNFPARHYMLVVGDHGQGFAGTGFDYLHKDMLDLKELKSALDKAPSKPDILIMDACEMGAVEVAYQLRDQARFLVASEEIVGISGLPHRGFLQHLTSHAGSTPRELAEELVSLSEDDTLARLDRGQDPITEQLSALRLDKMQALGKALGTLSRALEKCDIPPKKLKELIGETQSFNLGSQRKPDSDFRDLQHFLSLLQEECSQEQAVVKAAAAAQKALGQVIVANHCSGEELSDANGLSVYLPQGPVKNLTRRKAPNGNQTIAQSDFRYQDSDFDKAVGWSNWLERLAGRAR